MKHCVACETDKPSDQFFRRTSAKDGRASYCRPCQRDYLRQWKATHPAAVRENHRRDYTNRKVSKLTYGAQWRAANRERHTAMIKAWETRNPDRVRAKYQRYRQRHPAKFQQWQDNRRDSGRRRISNWVRRALEKAASLPSAPLTADQVYGRFALYGFCCYYCHKALTPRTIEADHRIPLSRGGLHCAANLVPCCRPCNARKHARTEREFRALG